MAARPAKPSHRPSAPRWALSETTAEYADTSVRTLRRWAAEGLITRYRHGRIVRYDLREIDALLTAGKLSGNGHGAA